MHKGKHLIVDCRNVGRDVCLDDRTMLRTLADAAERAGATVISQVRYRFPEGSPPGFTCVVLLDESHVSVHTYADLGMLAMDVFTCGTTEPLDVLEHVRAVIDLGDVEVVRLKRFGPARPRPARRTAASVRRAPEACPAGVAAMMS